MKQTVRENGSVTRTSAQDMAVRSQPHRPMPLSDSSAGKIGLICYGKILETLVKSTEFGMKTKPSFSPNMKAHPLSGKKFCFKKTTVCIASLQTVSTAGPFAKMPLLLNKGHLHGNTNADEGIREK